MFKNLLGEVKGIFNIITIIELAISLLFSLMGIIFISNTTININVMSILTGLLLITNGISSIFSYLKRGGIVLYNNNLIYGIILIVVGIFGLFLGNYLPIVLGIYFLVSGVQRINYGIFFKKFNESSWLLTFVIGILFIIVGIISFFAMNGNVIKVNGICLFGYGVINIIDMILFRRRSKYFLA